MNLELKDEHVALACVDTDGVDDKSDAAGGIVTTETVVDHCEARPALANNDATTYLEDHRGVIWNGPTNTNVSDFYVAVVTDGGDGSEDGV